MATKSQNYSDYSVGWICALEKEKTAAITMLDTIHGYLPKPDDDLNHYALGSIGEHNIVIACPPMPLFGSGSAATVIVSMISLFPSVKFCLLVGIGSGIPPRVRLGDVVVSTPTGLFPGLIQCDLGMGEEDRFIQTGSLNDTPRLLLTALSRIETAHELAGSRIQEYLDRLKTDSPILATAYLKSDTLKDVLFKADYSHVTQRPANFDLTFNDDGGKKEEEVCRFCDKAMVIQREPREMRIHYGLIASCNQAIKSAAIRDTFNRDFGGELLCMEMEATGLMNHIPCIAIRGICDYADSHETKGWRGHAMIVAAAYAKELLQYVHPRDLDREPSVKDIVRQIDTCVSTSRTDVLQTKSILRSEEDIQILEWLALDDGPRQRYLLSMHKPETCLWLLDSVEYQNWLNAEKQTLFCSGGPGTGKSVLTSVVVNDLEMRFQTNPTVGIAYIYSSYLRQGEQKVEESIASLLKQLIQRQKPLPKFVREIYNKHKGKQTRPSLDELIAAFHSTIKMYSRVFIIVDGIDECPTSSGCRQKLLAELFSIQKQFRANCFTTSRWVPEIIDQFKTTNMSVEIVTDLKTYVKSRMEKLQAFSELHQQLQETILSRILENAAGSFELAAIFLRLLNEKIGESSIMEALEDIVNLNPESSGATTTEIEYIIKKKEKLRGRQPIDDPIRFPRFPPLHPPTPPPAPPPPDPLYPPSTSPPDLRAPGNKIIRLSREVYPTSTGEVEAELTDVEKQNSRPSEKSKAIDSISREQFSDSGYASVSRDHIKNTIRPQNEAIAQKPCNTIPESDLNTGYPLEEYVSEEADDITEYSVATSLSDTRMDELVSHLADQLIDEAYLNGLDGRSIETNFSVLQELLKTFALKVGFNAKSQIQRDIMFYTHKYSRNIAHLFETRLHDRNRDRDSFGARIAPEISEEMTRDWLNNVSDPGDFESNKISDNQDMEEEYFQEDHQDQVYEEDGEWSVSDLGAYRDLIIVSPAYRWLLTILRRESLMETECSHSMEDIKQTILSSLKPGHKISRSRSAEAFRTTFLINWDPITFLKEQHYQGSLEEVIDRVITLTGSAKNAQALTILQYLRQTWPTTGEHVLQLVKDVLSGPRGQKYAGHLPEGTELAAWITNTEFIAEASGTRASVAEIGEQLAWLSASLRQPPYDIVINLCTPSVHIIQPDDEKSRLPNQDIHCRIECNFQKEQNISSDNGQCWHNMFRNSILVKGFPVLRRPKPDTGLEIPLNVMSALADAQRIDEFNRKIFIKGFSTMLIPTDYLGGVIVWHLQYRNDGAHISYFDACVPHMSIRASDMEQSRHIVGWCSQADLLAGATEAKYTVQRSGLPRPTADCILHNISISAGKYITGGVDFAMGIKDRPIHLTRGSYTPKLEWIHKKFIVLWDERYKRGWLVNGTTALLHLSRAALKRKQESPFKALLLYKSGSLKEATERFTAESAIQVLTNESNMKLKIYRGKSQHNERVLWRGTDKEKVVYEEKENFYRFQDLVDDLYNILEKMVEYQSYMTNKDGVSLKCRVRKHLDGWEFDDIIENQDCRPSVATLEAMGYGWVNLITDIGAVVLLGKDFGDIIQPSSTEMLCDRWSQMPENRYYLGACVSDLANIIRSYGEEGTEQLRLTSNISWHSSDKPFEPCRCKSATPSKHSYLVQELRKSKDHRGLGSSNSGKICSSTSLEPRGAVIFSHNYQLALKRDDIGLPTLPRPQLPPESSNNANALGSSHIKILVEGNDSSFSLNSGQLTPVMESTTSVQCDSHPGLHESQTEASIDDSLATSISYAQGHTVSRSQDSKKILGGPPLDNPASVIQDTKASASQENDSLGPRQKSGRRGRWKHFKQRFSNLSRKWDKD